MWRIILLLVVGSCYSSAEEYNVTVVELPKEPPPGVPELPASPAVPELPASPASPTVDSRIIGGVPATIESYPFAVQVVYGSQLVCGGSLVTRRHVLSAAHCFVDPRGAMYSASLFTVRVGTATLNSGGSTRRVSRIINHELYNQYIAREHDVSVLLLASAVSLSARVGTASIPNQGGWVPDNAPVFVVGWGRTNPNVNQPSSILNQVVVNTVNTNTCAIRYRQLELEKNEPFPVTPNMLCTGLLEVGGRDACQGDSGGPVIFDGVVVGVTSWGEGCGHPYYPGVNARIPSYTNWILDTIARNDSAPSLGKTSVCLLLLSFLISTVFQ